MTKKKNKTEGKEVDTQKSEEQEVDKEQRQASFREEDDEKPNVAQAAALHELNSTLADLSDKYLRLYSEFDNYRKRTAKEKLELSKTASEGVITSLLPVLDDMERAMQVIPEDKENDVYIAGLKLIYNKLKNILTQKGLTEIEATDQPFDTDYHEAVSHFAVADPEKKNRIIEVVQRGYKLSDKVIRYAKVVVGL
ncbi:MAG: nucleotide exchange factor GrpE [Bacteroidales bacterium]|nr:nucleotide exchange factor GrpE [Bacteroidales bacterium]MDZ4205288.1 nucleotide exchange factor GrpE [Bacteroidales bacterium]